jgi:hypothetical protein
MLPGACSLRKRRPWQRACALRRVARLTVRQRRRRWVSARLSRRVCVDDLWMYARVLPPVQSIHRGRMYRRDACNHRVVTASKSEEPTSMARLSQQLGMRPLHPHSLVLGHAGDTRDFSALRRAGIVTLVDLAVNEPPLSPPRELVYCRFPLGDGAGNGRGVLHAAIETTVSLVRGRVPTLLFCSAG